MRYNCPIPASKRPLFSNETENDNGYKKKNQTSFEILRLTF